MKHSIVALVCFAALAWPASALAAGGGDGGGSGGGGGGGMGPATSARNQDPDFVAGLAAVKAKDWQQALSRMGTYTQRKPDDAEGWNQLGYAYRNAGQIDPALDAYAKALKIDPRHRGAHEYLGEAYLVMGDLARAEEELKVLNRLCFFGCEEYNDLKRSITEYKMKGKPAAAAN
jgi:tetratricopeptide (TPR) repeat protein